VAESYDQPPSFAPRLAAIQLFATTDLRTFVLELGGNDTTGPARLASQVMLRDCARGELSQRMNVLEGGLRWTVTAVTTRREIIDGSMAGVHRHAQAAGSRRVRKLTA